MKILERYLLKELFTYFVLFLGVLGALLLAKEMYDTRDEILEEEPALADVAEYILLSLPAQVAEAIPLVAMFAVLFAIGFMAKNNEIRAMIAAGVSYGRLTAPVLVFGLSVTVGAFWFSEAIVPQAQNRAQYIFDVRIKGENRFAFTSNDEIFRKGEGRLFYVMASFDGADRTMRHPSILKKGADGRGVDQRIEARQGRLIGPGPNGGQLWELEGAEVWNFGPEGAVSVERRDGPLRVELEAKLDEFLQREKSPEEMGLAELSQFCAILRRQGARAQLARFGTALHGKFAVPLAVTLLTLIGFAIASDLQVRRFVLAFSVGLAFAIAYYVLREASADLGRGGLVPPSVAAWAPVALYGAIAGRLWRRLNTVH